MENLENRKPVKTGRFWKRALAGWAITMLASSPLWAQDFGLSVNGASLRISGGSQLVLGNTNMHVGLYDQYSGGTMNSTLEVDDDSLIVGPLTRIVGSSWTYFPVGGVDGPQKVVLVGTDGIEDKAVTVSPASPTSSFGIFSDGARSLTIIDPSDSDNTFAFTSTGSFTDLSWPISWDIAGGGSDEVESDGGSGSGGSTVVTTPEPTEPEPTEPEPTAPGEPVVVVITEGESATVADGVTGSISETEATLTSDSGVVVVVQRPAGSELPVFKDDGSVTVVLKLASGATAEQVAKADGTVAATFAIAGADGVVRETKLEVTGNVSFNDDGSMEVAIATESGAEQNLKINADGTMDAGLTVGGVKTDAKLPAGTEAKPTESGAIKLTSPVTLPGGGEVPISTGLNKSGQAIIKIPKVGDAKPVALPKTPPGAAVEIVGTTITITTPLGETVDATGRSTAAASAAETFVGRTTTGAEVLVYNQSSDAKFSFSRDLSAAESTTTITLVTGTARIRQGGVGTEVTLNSGYSITNDAIELSLAAKSNYVSLPANVALSTADLELDLGDVHSVWVWNTNTPGWEAFSADSATSALLDNASIVSLSDGVEVADGMFVYSTTAQDVAIADGRDLSISSVLASRSAPSNGDYSRARC